MTETDLALWVKTFFAQTDAARRRQLGRQLARGLRQRTAQRIARQRNPDGSPFAARKPRLRAKGERVRKRALFAKLRRLAHLRAAASADQVAIGFAGRAADIARIHQYGEIAEVSKGGPLHRYAQRQLLGFSDADREWVIESLSRQMLHS